MAQRVRLELLVAALCTALVALAACSKPVFEDPGIIFNRAGGNAKVWTIGDSLTYGTNGAILPANYVGWRLGLNQWIDSNAFGTQLLGTVLQGGSASPVPLTQPRTDGHPGFTLAQLSSEVGSVYGIGKFIRYADMVIFLGGTNDCTNGTYDPVTTPALYVSLLEQIYNADTQALIVVCTLPPIDPSYLSGVALANVLDFNSKLPAIWDSYDAPGLHQNKVIRCDYFAALTPWSAANFGTNAIHPIAVGYNIMWTTLQAALLPYSN